ncbi:MAG: hypothetical protein ACKKL5_02775 [Candidatus Komeilibacteria bacterium]
MRANWLKIVLSIMLIIVLLLFGFNVFKNIAYPLLWNDESETVMLAQRIRTFGYPKIHDGKNVIYQLNNPDLSLGAWSKYDAYISSGWLQYYFATLGSKWADASNDIYQKTARQRIPFAILGFTGILLIGLLMTSALSKKKEKIIAFTLFILLESLSIPLLLHLRQARYYPLLLFLIALTLLAYTAYTKTSQGLQRWSYSLALIFLLVLIFNTFWPAYFSLLLALGLYTLYRSYRQTIGQNKKTSLKKILVNLLPIIVSAITAIPLALFYKIFAISHASSVQFSYSIKDYLARINQMTGYFFKHEALYLLIILGAIMIGLWLYSKRQKQDLSKIQNSLQLVSLLGLFFICHTLFISLDPYFFERYYFFLQPLITVMTILCVYISWQLIKNLHYHYPVIIIQKTFLVLVITLFILAMLPRLPYLQNYAFELSHQYKGALDYAIPYIKENFTHPENLVIATNYDEMAYMYYLGSKTTIGFVGDNLQDDIKYQPDIIIYRKSWSNNTQIFNYLIQRAEYKKISLPIYDYAYNTIPEIDSHPFRTITTDNPKQLLDIFIKQ